MTGTCVEGNFRAKETSANDGCSRNTEMGGFGLRVS